MLRNDAIYNLLISFQNIDLSSVNDIYFAINIIIIIATMFLEVFIVVIFVFKFVIIIVIIVIEVLVIVVLIFEKSVFKLIVFDFNIKRRLAMSASLDKS